MVPWLDCGVLIRWDCPVLAQLLRKALVSPSLSKRNQTTAHIGQQGDKYEKKTNDVTCFVLSPSHEHRGKLANDESSLYVASLSTDMVRTS